MLLFIILPAAAFAESAAIERPHWSLEIKDGKFAPDIAGWTKSFGERSTGQFEGSLAYKILRQVDAGVAVGRIRDGGRGFAPLHQSYAGQIDYQLLPVQAFVVLRGIFTENQWVVPYVGGGWTRMYYKEELSKQAPARGYADGSHVRGGLQFLLDALDQRASTNMLKDFGVYRTYFFVETERTKAMINDASGVSTNLGGTSMLGGLLFEF